MIWQISDYLVALHFSFCEISSEVAFIELNSPSRCFDVRFFLVVVGVPFIVKAGKALDAKKVEIRVQFRDTPGDIFNCMMFYLCFCWGIIVS